MDLIKINSSLCSSGSVATALTICNGSNFIIISHNTVPVSMSIDPRYAHRDFESGRLISFSDDISAARRHVFTL